MKVPYLPKDAPFSDDQKSWLAGFYAGLHTQMAQGQQTAPSSDKAALTANVLFGTQTGNSEGVAEDLAAVMKANGVNAKVSSLDDIEAEDLTKMDYVLLVTSTYGEGEMPDNAELFWDALKASTMPRLEHMHFAVLALGDTAYDDFCEAGKQFDLRFEQLGAKRLVPRVDCDVDFEEDAEGWSTAVIEELSKFKPEGSDEPVASADEVAKPGKSKWTRKNPFLSPVTTNRLLSGEGSAKEIRHYEFDLSEDGPSYVAGDAFNIIPTNDPELVAAWLGYMGVPGDTDLPGKDLPLSDLLLNQLEISTPNNDFIKAVAERTDDDHLKHIVGHGDKEAMEAYLWSKDALDVVMLHPKAQFSVAELVDLFKPLQHRAYSISSSSKMHPDSVHLTIASVRYNSHGRSHGGVASCFLADRVGSDAARVFVSPNKSFRVPENNDAPMIMVGPGTGIAPFRAFLQERQAIGAQGINWLFFGDQHESCDFIYKDELMDMQNAGVLHRLDLAFSRDQKEKIYVQTRMRENAKDLYAALEEGGHFYVCGDATRMAKDVDQALLDIVAEQGGLGEDSAIDYVNALKKDKRYVRDVY
ncbi:sulfite reductase (NADPH) flavoprotein alpha-component [Cohaesibacter sp. ES.047]|uniref:diflavin oxidoreductase n=1 Tax=Cohaesibacter sp. ES.047 TaxID=1798205 RepID=UPI000BB905BA|nr:sulfite reductase flavoprotein subunit alpha [Cohaesibacter sp. ES.047]SNY93244.1 sulfite reductase (NADPH) flavoprotein alpha-component [Cohaesibacter sp. ES.047]